MPWRDTEICERTKATTRDLDAALRLAAELSDTAQWLGQGKTWEYFRLLASVGSVDLTTARVVEPHLDALTILQQAGMSGDIPQLDADATSTWGVYAAHSPGRHLDAEKRDGAWYLNGSKPWCSLADQLSHAVITAHVTTMERQAFAIRLNGEGFRPMDDEKWVSRGLQAITSESIALQDIPAVPVGAEGWYQLRRGFAWGAIAVAAVWFGGACGVQDALVNAASKRAPDQIALMHIGHTDSLLFSAQLALEHAATLIDAGKAEGDAGVMLAARVRALVAHAAEDVLTAVGHALGPGPLTHEEEHSRRVADLTVYLRQHHAERDLAKLGNAVAADRAAELRPAEVPAV